ncbi:cAMP-dependent protein kinase catalytic subunit-like [Drosophila busckii]|uniref:cAMP-dependent protein kinase catalytic subunit-like n=1 Tax=Drosophila busckii TaxID=30019 RepID=UPI00083F39B8|nr:cAMP-dependent protein kinase catalytic subunit-like [Drosophila busckii]
MSATVKRRASSGPHHQQPQQQQQQLEQRARSQSMSLAGGFIDSWRNKMHFLRPRSGADNAHQRQPLMEETVVSAMPPQQQQSQTQAQTEAQTQIQLQAAKPLTTIAEDVAEATTATTTTTNGNNGCMGVVRVSMNDAAADQSYIADEAL